MDAPEKKAATQNTIDQRASGHNSSSSSGKDSPDLSSHVSRTSKFQASSESAKNTNISSKIVEPLPTMLNVPPTENHKSSTSTVNAVDKEEESRAKVSGKVNKRINLCYISR